MDPTGPQLGQAAEKAKMAQAEEAQRAEVARLMETLTPAQALPSNYQTVGWDGIEEVYAKCAENMDYP